MTYSVPHTLADETVRARIDGDHIVVVHCASSGPVEVARHQRSTPGHPMIDDAHYPPRPTGPLGRQPKPASAAEAEFLAIGDGAHTWLVEAASAGTSRIKTKMAQAVDPARLHGHTRVDWALGHAATYGRFADGDPASILAAHPPGQRRRADDIISDDIGLLPVSAATAEVLYRVVDAAYEKRSIALSSNLHPAGFDESMPRPSPTPPPTGSCTTPTSSSPPVTASASPKPPPERG